MKDQRLGNQKEKRGEEQGVNPRRLLTKQWPRTIFPSKRAIGKKKDLQKKHWAPEWIVTCKKIAKDRR